MIEGVISVTRMLNLPEMDRVEEGLEESIKTDCKELDYLSSLLLRRQGKRIRPLLVILSSCFYPTDEEILVDVAIAVELIHTASLIHDDVIDEASMRRGEETINARWDNKMAVLTGDHLFARAFQLLTHHDGYSILPIMTSAISFMCAGEISQLSQNGTIRSESEYLHQIEKKTASLLAASCYVGGKISSMPEEETQRLYAFGLFLGYSFQIVDDIFDIAGSQKMGKPLYLDLQGGTFTLPLIYLLEDKEYGPQVKELLESESLRPSVLEYIKRALRESGSLERAHRKALYYVSLARKELKELPPVQARDYLMEIASYVVHRDPLKISPSS